MPLEGFDDANVDDMEPDFRRRAGPGAPMIQIDYAAVERAASIGCTKDEISAVLGISRAALYNHMNRDPEVKAAIDRGSDKGKATLRRMQWRGAESGNPTMLIWLGKQLLDQRDKSELTGADGNAIVTEVVYRWAPPNQIEGGTKRTGGDAE